MRLPSLKEIYKYLREASGDYPDFNKIFAPPTEPPAYGVPAGEVSSDESWENWEDLMRTNPAMREPFDKGDWQVPVDPLAAYSPPRPAYQQLPQAPGRRPKQEFTPQQAKMFAKMQPSVLSKIKQFFK